MTDENPASEIDSRHWLQEVYDKSVSDVSTTLSAAEAHLGIPPGTLSSILSDPGFMIVMKMATTIEPILNDALEAEVKRLRVDKVEHEGAAAIAKFIREDNRFGKKVDLAHDLGLIRTSHYEFIDSLMYVRGHYAHHVRNLSLSLLQAVRKAMQHRNDKKFEEKMFGSTKLLDAQNPVVAEASAKLGVFYKFAGFLASALHVIEPPPHRGLLGVYPLSFE